MTHVRFTNTPDKTHKTPVNNNIMLSLLLGFCKSLVLLTKPNKNLKFLKKNVVCFHHFHRTYRGFYRVTGSENSLEHFNRRLRKEGLRV